MTYKIPYSRQKIEDDDIEAVVKALRNDFLTQGPIGFEFEKSIQDYCGVDYSLSCSSATAGLHMSYLALGLMPGMRIWTTPITFVATANAAMYCGAFVEFVDIDSETRNISIYELERKLFLAKKNNELPHIIVAVHFSGLPCEIAEISDLAIKYNVKVVEDASHALGASYLNCENHFASRVGNSKYSDATVFSFHPVKMITTGEGGMITTNLNNVKDEVILLRSHGITRNAMEMIDAIQSGYGWYYEQKLLGFNYRLSDINAALGKSQLNKLEFFLERRRRIADAYLTKIDGEKFKMLNRIYLQNSSWHIFVLELRNGTSIDRNNFYSYLRACGIEANLHYIPLYKFEIYKRSISGRPDCPNAEKYFDRCITIPLHQSMSEDEVEYVINRCNTYQ